MAFPTFDLSRAPPGKMKMPYVSGGGVEGGRSFSGVDSVIDMTGGGLVCVGYSDIELGNIDPLKQLYWSQLGGILNSRVRSIIVPLLTDFIAPGAFVATVQPAALNAATITINLTSIFATDRLLQGGEWFGIVNPTTSNRAHVVTDIDSSSVPGDGTASYTVGIAPPLREAIVSTTSISFSRPSCLMRLASGSQVTSDVDSVFWTTPEISFIESFGTV